MFKELGLSQQDSDQAIIEALARHPILIERPIVIKYRSGTGRLPENVLSRSTDRCQSIDLRQHL